MRTGHRESCPRPVLVLAPSALLSDFRVWQGVRYQLVRLILIIVSSVLAGAEMVVELSEWAVDIARFELVACGIGAPHVTNRLQVFEIFLSDGLDPLVTNCVQGVDQRQPSRWMARKCAAPRAARGAGNTCF